MLLWALVLACSTGSREELVVFAASSLSEPMTEIGVAWGLSRTELDLVQVFDGSNRLRTQLAHGGPAQVFVSASADQMAVAVKDGLVVDPRPLVSNRVVLALAPDGTGDIRTLEDIVRREATLVVAAADVPLGQYTREAMDRLPEAALGEKLLARVVSEETNAGQVLSRIRLGAVQAGVIYASDSEGLTTLSLPPIDALYQVALTPDATAAAQDYLVHLLQGQEVFTRHGFSPP